MGAWGDGPFENDSALDAILDLIEGEVSLKDFLEEAEKSEIIDADNGAGIVALAALIIGERPLDEETWEAYTEFVDGMTAAEISRVESLLPKVADPATSELAELWEETNEFYSFQSKVERLIQQL